MPAGGREPNAPRRRGVLLVLLLSGFRYPTVESRLGFSTHGTERTDKMICSFCGRLPSIAVSRNHKIGVCKACATTDGELDNFINAAIKAVGETPGSGLPVSTTQFSTTGQLHGRPARRRGSS